MSAAAAAAAAATTTVDPPPRPQAVPPPRVAPSSFLPSRHIVAFKLKAVVLLAVVVLFIYLQAESSMTSNWDDFRRVGFSEFQRCDGPSAGYVVSDAPVHAGALLTIPLVYSTSANQPPQVCFSDAALANCFNIVFSASPYAKLDAATVKTLFNIANGRSYFPLSVWITLLSCLSLFITQIYEQKTRLFVPRVVSEALSDRAVSIVMTRGNYILCITIVGLLFGSATNFTTLFKEDCNVLFHAGAGGIHDAKAFCNGISGCNAEVASVVNPHTFFFDNYPGLLIFLALALLLSTLIQCFSFLVCGRDPDDDVFVINRAAYDNSYREGPTILAQLRGRRASEEKRKAVERAERMAKHWITVPPAQLMSLRPEASEYDGECPICLTSLCPERLNLLLRKKPMRAVRQLLSRSFGTTPRAGPTPVGSVRMANANANADNTSGRLSGRIVGAIAAVRAKPIFNTTAGTAATAASAAIAIAPESNNSRRHSSSNKSSDSGKYARVSEIQSDMGVIDDAAPGRARNTLTSRIANLSSRLADMSGRSSPASPASAAGGGGGGSGADGVPLGESLTPLEPIHEATKRSGQHPLFSENSVESDEHHYDDSTPDGLLSGHRRSSAPPQEGFMNELIRRLSVTVENIVSDATGSRRGSGNRPVDSAADGSAHGASPLVGGGVETSGKGAVAGSAADRDVESPQLTARGATTARDVSLVLDVPADDVENGRGDGVCVQDIEVQDAPDASGRRDEPPAAAAASGAPDGAAAAGGGATEPTDTSVVVKVPCQHVFHRSCLMEWAMTSCLCPLCRAPLAPGVRMGRPDDDEV